MTNSRVRVQPFLLVVVAGAIAMSGCTSFEVARVRNDVSRDAPALRVGEGFSVAFGRATVGLARLALGAGSDKGDSDHIVREALRHVRKVEIGRYPLASGVYRSSVGALPSLARYEGGDWTKVVSTRDTDEAAFVYVRERGETLTQALVVSFDATTLTIVKLSGNLDAALRLILQSVDNSLQRKRDGATDRAIQNPPVTVGT